MKKIAYTALAFSFPFLALAQNNRNMDTLPGIFDWFIDFMDAILIPFIFSLALILFLFGVFKYFFGSGANAEENRQQGKRFILWGIIAFVVMVSIWGFVNVIVRTFGFQDETRPALPTFGNGQGRRSAPAPAIAPTPPANTPVTPPKTIETGKVPIGPPAP